MELIKLIYHLVFKYTFWPRIITSLITIALLWWWTPIAAIIAACIWAIISEGLLGVAKTQLREWVIKEIGIDE